MKPLCKASFPVSIFFIYFGHIREDGARLYGFNHLRESQTDVKSI